jgi:hypothetical protein
VSHSESPSVPLYTIAICWLTVQQLPLVLFISGLVFRLADEGAGQQATSKSEPVFRTVMSPAVAGNTGCFGDCSATGAEQVLSLSFKRSAGQVPVVSAVAGNTGCFGDCSATGAEQVLFFLL